MSLFYYKKIIKTEIAKKAVKTIKDEYLNSHILIYADTILFITIFLFLIHISLIALYIIKFTLIILIQLQRLQIKDKKS